MRIYVAESVGTFVLVFGGCGSAVLAGDHIGNTGVAFAFGLSLLAMVYAIGPISGCHVNPAVTVGLALCRKLEWRKVSGYVLAQALGAVFAAFVLLAIAKGGASTFDPAISGFASNGYGEHSPGGYGMVSAFLVETILTSFLVFTVLGATDIAAPLGFAGIAIGLVLTLIHLVGIPVTNTSVNPARSLGPALVVGGTALTQLWLFVVAPFAGSLLAATIYLGIRTPSHVLSSREAESATIAQKNERTATVGTARRV